MKDVLNGDNGAGQGAHTLLHTQGRSGYHAERWGFFPTASGSHQSPTPYHYWTLYQFSCTLFVFAACQHSLAITTLRTICIITLMRPSGLENVHARQKSDGLYDAAVTSPVRRKWGLDVFDAPSEAVRMKGAQT